MAESAVCAVGNMASLSPSEEVGDQSSVGDATLHPPVSSGSYRGLYN